MANKEKLEYQKLEQTNGGKKFFEGHVVIEEPFIFSCIDYKFDEDLSLKRDNTCSTCIFRDFLFENSDFQNDYQDKCICKKSYSGSRPFKKEFSAYLRHNV